MVSVTPETPKQRRGKAKTDESPKKRGRRPGKPKTEATPKTETTPKSLKLTLTPRKPETEANGKAKPAKAEKAQKVGKPAKAKPKPKTGTRPKLPRTTNLQLQSSPAITENGQGSLAYSMGNIPKLEPGSSENPPKPVIELGLDGTVNFHEPEVAPPKPGILGITLESAPPPKPKRQQVRRKKHPVPEVDEAQLAEKENIYRDSLQNVKQEDDAQLSELREQPKRRGLPLDEPAPATPRGKRSRAEPSSRSSKRLKVISPKRPTALLVAPAAPPAEESDNVNENDDFCSTCGGTGIFICCESCPKSFHLLCCDPPLRDVPEDNWSCNECLAAQGQIEKKSYNHLGMFGPLINSVHGRNPSEFRLPRRLREATFVDVSTGPEHKYADSSLKPDLSYAKANGAQIPGYNVNVDLEVDSLYNKNGEPYLCHKCKLSGSNRRTMVACDYCPLKWHLDCLPEPTCSAKTLGQKWRCPAHVESLVPDFILERRSFRDAVVIDAAAHNKFLQFQMANNFLVKHSDQPYLSEHKAPSLQEYIAYQKGDYISNNTDFVAKFHEQFGSQPEVHNDDEVPEFKLPDFLQNYATNGMVVAKGSRKTARILSMTNADDPDQKPFIYRVPEQSILLDFLHKASGKSEILNYIKHYEDQRDTETEQEMAAVGTLMAIQSQDIHNGSNGTSDLKKVERIEPEELEELRQIKKLIQQKGKDALLKLLQ